MFTQKLRSSYIESPVGLSSGFFKPDFSQNLQHWEATASSHGYDHHGAFENESDSALTKIYDLNTGKAALSSPLMPEQMAKLDVFTPEMKPQPRLDDLELQVLSSAPSELSSWSESEDKPNLVKYDSESSLEHMHSIHFSPEQFAESGSRLNFGHAQDISFHHDHLNSFAHTRSDPYHLGWRYFSHDAENSNLVDLNEMVDDVFSGNAGPDRAVHEHKNLDIAHEQSSMPMGLRNALSSSQRAIRPTHDATASGKFSHSFTISPRVKQVEGPGKPTAQNFMLNTWPVNESVIQLPSATKGPELNAALRVPLPCLSATERWKKHASKYTLDPKLSGDMVCTHCDQTFTDVEEYTTHLDEEKVVHDNFCPDASCAFAALGYRYRWLLRRHICNHHLKDYNNKKLRKNSSPHGGKSALTDNFLSHVYVCKKKNCSRAFYRSDSLSRHEKLIHSVTSKQKRKERLKLTKCDPKIFE